MTLNFTASEANTRANDVVYKQYFEIKGLIRAAVERGEFVCEVKFVNEASRTRLGIEGFTLINIEKQEFKTKITW